MSDFSSSIVELIELLNAWVDKIRSLGNEDDLIHLQENLQVIDSFDDERVGAKLIELLTQLTCSNSLTGTIADVQLFYGNQPFNESHFIAEIRHAVSLLWNCAAHAGLKQSLVEDGAVRFALKLHACAESLRFSNGIVLTRKDAASLCEASVAVIHNLSEFKANPFGGRRDMNRQLHQIYECGVGAFVIAQCEKARLQPATSSLHQRFLLVCILAQLSMNEENRSDARLISALSELDLFYTFLKTLPDTSTKRLFSHWLALVPFTCLLASDLEPVQLFACRCLSEFIRFDDKMKDRMFRSMAVEGNGVRELRLMAKQTRNVTLSTAASELLMAVLGPARPRGLPDIMKPMAIENSRVAIDRSSMTEFADVTLIVGDLELKAHKVILASRSTYFQALFRTGARMSEGIIQRIPIVCDNNEAFVKVLDFVYSLALPKVDAQSAYDMLTVSQQFGVDNVTRELEFVLWQQIDDETCVPLLQLCDAFPLDELKQHCSFYAKKHFERLSKLPNWDPPQSLLQS